MRFHATVRDFSTSKSKHSLSLLRGESALIAQTFNAFENTKAKTM